MSVNSSGHLSEARCALFRTNMSICQVVMFVDMKLRISFRTTWSLRKTEAVPLHSLHLDQSHGKSGNQTWLAGKPLIFSMFFPFETSTYSGVFGVPLHVSVRFPKKVGGCLKVPESSQIRGPLLGRFGFHERCQLVGSSWSAAEDGTFVAG
jgi:hypothetical protein